MGGKGPSNADDDRRPRASTADGNMDREALSEIYGHYRSEDVLDRWSKENPGNRFLLEERLAEQERRLSGHGLTAAPIDILDVGCGGATSLPAALDARVRIGVDLLLERLVSLDPNGPLDAVACADGTRLPFPERSFDLIVLSTVLSSIDSELVRAQLAADVARVLRPGGLVVVYDIRIPNPANRAISPVTRRQLGDYFAGFEIETHPITLIPQIARRLGDRRWLYSVLARIPLLRSHCLAVARKP